MGGTTESVTQSGSLKQFQKNPDRKISQISNFSRAECISQRLYGWWSNEVLEGATKRFAGK